MVYLRTYGILLLLGAVLSIRTVRAQNQADTAAVIHGAELRLAETVYDFGDVPRRGGDLCCEIPFTNTGDVPLVVTRLVTSNSCLKVSCSRRPIAPGGGGVIRIVYQPLKSEAGAFSRVVQIGSNSIAGDTHITVQGNSFEEQVPVRRRFLFWKTKVKIK